MEKNHFRGNAPRKMNIYLTIDWKAEIKRKSIISLFHHITCTFFLMEASFSVLNHRVMFQSILTAFERWYASFSPPLRIRCAICMLSQTLYTLDQQFKRIIQHRQIVLFSHNAFSLEIFHKCCIILHLQTELGYVCAYNVFWSCICMWFRWIFNDLSVYSCNFSW